MTSHNRASREQAPDPTQFRAERPQMIRLPSLRDPFDLIRVRRSRRVRDEDRSRVVHELAEATPPPDEWSSLERP